ncbi:MAG: acyl-CoA dehydrogenase family protein [Myxococcales bacterium]|nr:acyl-CoA dehydrogenase family protein [Myxococcales bacterium]
MQPTEAQRGIRDQFRRFMTEELERATPAFEQGSELPYALMRRMVETLGLGGSGGGGGGGSDTQDKAADDPELAALMSYARTQLTVEMCRVNPGFALSFGASTGLFGSNVRGKGTAEQVAKYAGPVMRFEKIGCWCLTEPGAGSDALRSMKTRARRDGDEYVISGEKTFVTNAPHADYFLIYAKSDDGSVQAFIAERGAPGLTTSEPFKKMGMRSSPTGAVYMDELRVPADNLLGGGVKDRDHVRSSLASERIGLALMGYGIAERCFEIALDYAKTHHRSGQPIGNFQLVQQRLARMYVALSNARRIVYSSEPTSVLDACAGKLYVGEVGTQVAMDAIHILGGNGYMEEYVVERLARDAKLVEIGGGTTEMQILTIARHLLA